MLTRSQLEVPRPYFDRQRARVDASSIGDWQHRRTTYQAMVAFMDDAMKNITLKLQERDMYNDTLYVFSSVSASRH